MPAKYPFVIFYFVSVCLMSVSCSIRNKLPGTYYLLHKISPNGLDLTLKPDSTFRLMFWSDILGISTLSGTWHRAGNKLFFYKQETKKDTLPIDTSIITMVEKFDGTRSNICIKAIDSSDNTPIVGATINVNQDQENFNTNTEGKVLIYLTQPLTTVSFSFIPIRKTFQIINPKTNDVTFNVNFKELPKVNDLNIPPIYLIKGKKIIPILSETQSKPGTLIKDKNSL